MLKRGGDRAKNGPKVSVSLTKIGWIWVICLLILAGAVANTGNNPLALIFAISCGLAAVVAVTNLRALKRISWKLELPREVFAGVEAHGAVTLNSSSHFPLFLLSVRVGRFGRGVVPELKGGEETSVALRFVFPRRGRFRLPELFLTTELPLSILRFQARWVLDRELVVWPAPLRGPMKLATVAAGWGRVEGEEVISRGGEPWQLREYVQGDDPRDIHWKQTAKHQKLIVVDRIGGRPSKTVLKVEGRNPDEFEAAVGRAAYWVIKLLDAGHEVSVMAGSQLMGPARSKGEKRLLLDKLAVVEYAGGR